MIPQPSLPKARIFTVDDHPVFLEGVVGLINQQNDLICCGHAGTIAEAQGALAECEPDLLLLDLKLGNGDGLEFIKLLKAQYPDLRILVLSQFDEVLYAQRALQAGALGYLMKECAAQELLTAVRTVLAGDYYVSRKITVLVLHKMVQGSHSLVADGIDNLTNREMHVFQLLGAGMKSREIAVELTLGIKTIETYREHIKHKLRLSCAAELISAATRWVQRPGGVASPIQTIQTKQRVTNSAAHEVTHL